VEEKEIREGKEGEQEEVKGVSNSLIILET
jgi:hypothetical protein